MREKVNKCLIQLFRENQIKMREAWKKKAMDTHEKLCKVHMEIVKLYDGDLEKGKAYCIEHGMEI